MTVIVVAIYFAAVLGVQAATQPLVGQTGQGPIIIVGTTLLVAALFAPLRRRIQALIDRTFYRSKYDATRTLTEFGAKLRTETDLEALREHLRRVAALRGLGGGRRRRGITGFPVALSWVKEHRRADLAPATGDQGCASY